MSYSYVLTGGTGNTSLKLASQLYKAGHKAIVASTKGPEGVPAPFTGVKFDWTDESTYSNTFPADSNIKGVYLLTPGLSVTIEHVKTFIKLARKSNVNRFVSLTATRVPPHMKQIEDHLKELGEKEGVEWTILRPSWFYENFTRQLAFPIKASDSFSSATQNGKLGFLSSDDIAAIAFSALTDTKAHNTDHLLVGPELLSYDEVASILSEVVGRKITHNKLSGEQQKAVLIRAGLPEKFAAFMVAIQEDVAAGLEEKLIAEESSKIVKGKTTIREFFEKNKATWAK